jgi:hypothetical protein
MIIKTALNPNAGNLFLHLTNRRDGNEDIHVAELRGFASGDLRGALREAAMQRYATHCDKVFYHVSFAVPEQDADKMTSERWAMCADRFERELGLEGHQRAVVQHFKDGRWHQHVVWNRINPETMKAAQLSHERREAIRVARALEKELGLTQVSSRRPAHRADQRPPLEWEKEQARRSHIDADLVRDSIARSWAETGTGQDFDATLQQRGLTLAKGDRRAFVVLDEDGNFYALGARSLPGENSRTIAAKLADVAPDLPNVEQARELIRERELSKRHKRGRKGDAGRGKGDSTGGPTGGPTIGPQAAPETGSAQQAQTGQQPKRPAASETTPPEPETKPTAEAQPAPAPDAIAQRYRRAHAETARAHKAALAQLAEKEKALTEAHDREREGFDQRGPHITAWDRLTGKAAAKQAEWEAKRNRMLQQQKNERAIIERQRRAAEEEHARRVAQLRESEKREKEMQRSFTTSAARKNAPEQQQTQPSRHPNQTGRSRRLKVEPE